MLDLYRVFTAAWDRWIVLTRLNVNGELAGALVSAGGFDWSSAGISAAALAGLLIVSIAVVSGVRHGKNRKGRETK